MFNEFIYADLQNEILFRQVKVNAGRYGFSWSDNIDISEFELCNIGVETKALEY